jgi:hypothetical protein
MHCAGSIHTIREAKKYIYTGCYKTTGRNLSNEFLICGHFCNTWTNADHPNFRLTESPQPRNAFGKHRFGRLEIKRLENIDLQLHLLFCHAWPVTKLPSYLTVTLVSTL